MIDPCPIIIGYRRHVTRRRTEIMKNDLEWTDFRYFLEVARTGKISTAGERLNVEHSTVSRRINRLEESLGSVLFDRRRNGYSLTDAGKALVPHAERMENAMLGALEEHMSQSTSIHGTVRVGTPEAFGIHVLASGIVELNRLHPDLLVELMAQPQFPSLVTREVEILVTLEPPQMGRYTVTRLADVDYFFYSSRAYLDTHAPIRDLADIAEHDFVDYVHDGSVSERYRILDELVSKPKRRFTSTSVLAQREAVAAGMGIGLLTPYVATGRPDLINLFPDHAQITRTLWLAAPEDLFKTRRIRFVWDFIRGIIDSHPHLFRR
ncbi:LysR family transcriptional regulator [Caballeronia hypogeia]|uniref:LysR family transcriptional regulator n=2 Tax=Caballeronia hypogeia TaxID=1777140 RepID=A0A158A7C7_9BURK|nr:LysR family transcriptional regulator [Caballeronia hypogeia]